MATKTLAYTVLPATDGDLPRLAVAGGRDRSEYEFERVEFAPGVLAAVVRQAIDRIEKGRRIFASFAEDGAARKLAQKWLRRLDGHHEALSLAALFIGDGPAEMGGGGMGADWGGAVRATLHTVKRVEAVLRGMAFGFGRHHTDPEERAACEEIAAELAVAFRD